MQDLRHVSKHLINQLAIYPSLISVSYQVPILLIREASFLKITLKCHVQF